MNTVELEKKIQEICSNLLNEKGYVTSVDVLIRLQYLSKEDYEDWRFGRIDYLERVCHVNLGRLSRINSIIMRQARKMDLKPSWTAYNKYGKGKKIRLRFSKSGDEDVEKNYATHYISQYHIRKTEIVVNSLEETHASNKPLYCQA